MTKFIGEKQSLDPAAAAKVVVRLGGRRLEVEVPAGEVRLVGKGVQGAIDPNN